MTPLSVAHTELRLYVQQTEAAHHALEAAQDLRHAAGQPAAIDAWEGLRTAAIAQLWEMLERVEPTLGLRLMKALYPVFTTDEELALPRVYEQQWPVPYGSTRGEAQA